MDFRAQRKGRFRLHATPVILLDTHALIWILAGHKRVVGLLATGHLLFFSPISVLEMRFLIEAKRARIAEPDWEARLGRESRFKIDDCRLGPIVAAASDLGFTRDPFDRLLSGHAMARGFRLATADARLIDHLPKERVFPL